MSTIASQDHEAVRVLTLTRPEVRNALSAALIAELQAAVQAAAHDPAVRVVVLTGSGAAFCAGLDLSELEAISSRSAEENRADSEAFMQLLDSIYRCPKPVLAAVNGHAVAGGAGLVSVCDLAVMSERAKLGYTESRIGFVAALVAVFLVRLVGEKVARDLLLSGRLITAQEALSFGLVNAVVPPDEVLPRTLERARELVACAPTSLAMTKGLLAALPAMGLGEGLRYAADLNALARSTSNLREGVSAFLAKRDPVWT